MIEATDGADTRYIAMEVSFTADRRDCDRAIRNAGLITRFTGTSAQAAIGSVREAAEAVESGAVYLPRWRTGHGVPSELRRSRPQPSLTERKTSCQQKNGHNHETDFAPLCSDSDRFGFHSLVSPSSRL